MSKIQFRELFTTMSVRLRLGRMLCEICQRYNFESYSQQVRGNLIIAIVVWDMSKIQFRELFTTNPICAVWTSPLCEICQRYNFESYSQHLTPVEPHGCVVWDMSKIQFRELFTTHSGWLLGKGELCEICQRYNFESYSQQSVYEVYLRRSLCEICQRYNFESYSQPVQI